MKSLSYKPKSLSCQSISPEPHWTPTRFEKRRKNIKGRRNAIKKALILVFVKIGQLVIISGLLRGGYSAWRKRQEVMWLVIWVIT